MALYGTVPPFLDPEDLPLILGNLQAAPSYGVSYGKLRVAMVAAKPEISDAQMRRPWATWHSLA